VEEFRVDAMIISAVVESRNKTAMQCKPTGFVAKGEGFVYVHTSGSAIESIPLNLTLKVEDADSKQQRKRKERKQWNVLKS
jgi:hypothetical protein